VVSSGPSFYTVRTAIEIALKTLTVATLPFAERLDWLPLPHMLRFRRAKAQLDGIIYRLIQERRAGGDRGDLLSLLLLAQDAEGDGTGMTDLQLRDEAMTLLLAGHETTANALTWTWYLVSQHPAVERELHEELDRTLGGRAPSADDLPDLPYTRRVLSEAMRLYPPAWVVGRRAVIDCEVGTHTVPSGALVFVSQWVTHRDPRFFVDPERFDPERLQLFRGRRHSRQRAPAEGTVQARKQAKQQRGAAAIISERDQSIFLHGRDGKVRRPLAHLITDGSIGIGRVRRLPRSGDVGAVRFVPDFSRIDSGNLTMLVLARGVTMAGFDFAWLHRVPPPKNYRAASRKAQTCVRLISISSSSRVTGMRYSAIASSYRSCCLSECARL